MSILLCLSQRFFFSTLPRLRPYFSFFFLMIRPPPRSTLFPYPTLFRSLEARLRAAGDERAYLESVRALIEQATSGDDLFDLRRELAGEGYIRGRAARTRPSATAGPRGFILADGATVLVGRTNHENDVLTFKRASPDDIWLHARGLPGAHVILKSGAKLPLEDTLQQAAAIAAYFSRARGAAGAAVDVTRRRYVRKPRGAKPGQVTYTHERTLTVKPELPGTGERGNAGTPTPAPPARGGAGERDKGSDS